MAGQYIDIVKIYQDRALLHDEKTKYQPYLINQT